jgi:alkaline phosphatase
METIAAQLLETDVDLLIGGGQNHFEARKDSRNISNELSKKGYQVHSFMTKTLSETEPNYKDNFLYFTAASLPLSVEQGRDYLPLATSFSIDFLKNHSSNGFFLMVESSQIDWGGHNNNSDYIIQEMLDFDKVIGAALDFAEADRNTLVIVTSDHETGGYSINYGSSRKKFKTGFTTDYHTAQMVPVFAYGPNEASFMGIYDNTDIFKKMIETFGIEE